MDDETSAFTCPITLGIMKNPVIFGDGYTYEYDAIRRHIQRNNPVKSPITNEVVTPCLVPNKNLRDIMSKKGYELGPMFVPATAPSVSLDTFVEVLYDTAAPAKFLPYVVDKVIETRCLRVCLRISDLLLQTHFHDECRLFALLETFSGNSTVVTVTCTLLLQDDLPFLTPRIDSFHLFRGLGQALDDHRRTMLCRLFLKMCSSLLLSTAWWRPGDDRAEALQLLRFLLNASTSATVDTCNIVILAFSKGFIDSEGRAELWTDLVAALMRSGHTGYTQPVERMLVALTILMTPNTSVPEELQLPPNNLFPIAIIPLLENVFRVHYGANSGSIYVAIVRALSVYVLLAPEMPACILTSLQRACTRFTFLDSDDKDMLHRLVTMLVL